MFTFIKTQVHIIAVIAAIRILVEVNIDRLHLGMKSISQCKIAIIGKIVFHSKTRLYCN